jgi:hypothetical protein
MEKFPEQVLSVINMNDRDFPQKHNNSDSSEEVRISFFLFFFCICLLFIYLTFVYSWQSILFYTQDCCNSEEETIVLEAVSSIVSMDTFVGWCLIDGKVIYFDHVSACLFR